VCRAARRLEEDENRSVALCLKLLVFTGMRSGEAKGLRWENVDLEGRRVHLPDTKSGKSQIVVLSPEARDILEACREFRAGGNPFVFPGQGVGGHLTDLRGCFQRSRDRAGLGGDVVIHTLRHTYASLLANSGVDGRVIQESLRHASSRTTQRYAHLSDRRLDEAAAVVADQIRKATG